MALRDHFNPPLKDRRHWHAFHNGWAYNISEDLNLKLPEGYFAEANVQFGIEIDVAAFEEDVEAPVVPLWHPPSPTKTIPFSVITDTVEIAIYDGTAGPIIVGAIEIVSPANKDRPAHRHVFVSKCETYLQQGIGLVIVDIVTNHYANLHDELMAHLETEEADWGVPLSCTAYRPVEYDGETRLDIWQEELQLGHPLPTMPLWLRSCLCLPVDLNTTYERTSRAHRIRD